MQIISAPFYLQTINRKLESLKRIIPSSGESIPGIGLGTWQSFNVSGEKKFASLSHVLKIMHDSGNTLIDSSPMYGKSEQVIGELTSGANWSNDLFYATKVWTTGKQEGIRQMENSFRLMKRKTIDLMQVHNLVDWKTHLATLKEWKTEGKIRYIGITHYTDSAHEDLEQIINSQAIDFVQFNYSVFSRHAEKRLLNVAADRGVATIINRPFGEGSAFSKVKNKPLPEWAKEYTIVNWSRFFLLYIISHPAVTVVIPATGNPDHALENFKPLTQLPDQSFRKRMIAWINTL